MQMYAMSGFTSIFKLDVGPGAWQIEAFFRLSIFGALQELIVSIYEHDFVRGQLLRSIDQGQKQSVVIVRTGKWSWCGFVQERPLCMMCQTYRKNSCP
jgi:hypothetical protein